MKRSKKAALVLMAPATTWILAGCGEQPVDALVFNDAQECIAYHYSSAECQEEFERAAALHAEIAPRYWTQQECEADFGQGQCETAPDPHQGSGVFMPLMMGYMVGRLLTQGRLAASQTSQAAGRSAVPTQPLYQSRDDRMTFRTATNHPVSTRTGQVSVQPSAVQPQRAQMVRRGGFGQQAAAHSRFGG